MQHPLEIHIAYVDVVAQDTPYSFLVDAQHLCDLPLGWASLASDQRTDSVRLSSVTRPPGPGQISKLCAPAIEGCGPLLEGPQRDHILTINFLAFGEDCLIGGMLEP
jgi:hypothetical protein